MANSERIKRWFSSNTRGGVLFYVVSFTHQSFTDYWINDLGINLNVTLEDGFTNQEVTFLPFTIKFAPTKNTTLQEISLTVDNVDNTLYEAIRSIPLEEMNIPIKAEIRFYLDDDLQTPQNDTPIRLEVERIDAKGASLTISLVAPNLRDIRRFLRYNPNRFPTLYTFWK